jgi:hypothetical protein
MIDRGAWSAPMRTKPGTRPRRAVRALALSVRVAFRDLTLTTFDQLRLHRNAPFSRSVRSVTGAAQQPLHLARPLLFLDLDESLQFAQMMGNAQGVQHAEQSGKRAPITGKLTVPPGKWLAPGRFARAERLAEWLRCDWFLPRTAPRVGGSPGDAKGVRQAMKSARHRDWRTCP